MISGPYFVLVVMAALWCGLASGVFVAFSTFVMRGLGALPAGRGIAAMNAINIAAVNPAFMAAFLGAAALCVMVTVVTFVVWPDQGTVTLLLGCTLYLLGAFGVTITANIPRNEALAELAGDEESERSAAYWRRYLREWVAWNHIRGAAAFAATVSFVLALT
ncbi:anthrone oxygenase family protein [Streptomyces beihaiensis]|uniref:DUF1772 domain-containing protein n=1 Tax=Streptomyces beihaiensis TaxID=2984495 RepID=A0ABT3TTA9_9ACTN|nr:anthrone oxygenase family protein [Streptomyces beihaiensis]MCX3060246.1 DUF1772 domain-containing protein [Streptomyces beihaiensis]